jgi:alpha-tubulin suppressor-like RCC1 family protein
VTTLTSSIAFVSAGFYHTCALQTDGDLYCWGEDDYGALGAGSSFQSVDTPSQVTLF